MTGQAQELGQAHQQDSGVLERIEKLEKQGLRMKLLVAALLVVIVALLITSQVSATSVPVKQIVLESHEVKLVDAEGNTRFFLRLYSKVPILQLLGTNGKPRLSLGLRFDDTPFIDLSDENGDTRAVFEMTAEDEPTLRLLDREGNTSFAIN